MKILPLALAAILFIFSGFAFGGNEAYIAQVGDWNIAEISQKGIVNIAEVSQEGNRNDANTVCDLGKDYKICCEFDTLGWLQYQEGDYNAAYLRIEGDYNHVSQWQKGVENYADIDIEGSYNIVKQIQLGDFNKSLAEIIGDNNILCHYQEGNNLQYPLITIEGNFQTICVIQK